MKTQTGVLASGAAIAVTCAALALASNHREAPITALDHKADITDMYAFVSYGPGQVQGQTPEKVTLIMAVDPLLEPANGPTLFPFDPEIRYEIKIDNASRRRSPPAPLWACAFTDDLAIDLGLVVGLDGDAGGVQVIAGLTRVLGLFSAR